MECTEKCEEVIRAEEDLKNLIGWQKSQNGAIHEVNKKVDHLQYWIMGLLGSSVLSLMGTVILLLKK